MITLRKMSDLPLRSQRYLIREDFNVPMQDGRITNDARIRAAIPTIEMALKQGAAVILVSHLGRPEEGVVDPNLSLEPVAKRLSELLKKPVRFEKNWLNGIGIVSGEIVLCENVRFCKGEKADADDLAKKIANLCDVFVMDAFAVAHRAQASTHGVAKFARSVCAGPLLVAEIEALTKVLKNPAHPLIAIVGGGKVSTKIMVLKSLFNVVDRVIVGGGIANTFLAAAGFPVGKSLCEYAFIDAAKELMKLAEKQNVEVPLPIDVVVAKECKLGVHTEIKAINDIADDDMILDIGPQTIQKFAKYIAQAGTILWNGPVGVFEIEEFSNGTQMIGKAITQSYGFKVAGGGDTIAAIEKYDLQNQISYISTGGGAFLEFLEGKAFPILELLEQRA